MSDLSSPRPLGRTGLTVRPVGLGTARLGAFWQGRSVADGRQALAAALDGGIDLVDTADCYARGVAERLVGRAVRDRPAVVMTKVGLLKTPVALASAARHAPGGGRERLTGLRTGPEAATCFASGYVYAAARRCLRRQRVDRLDVLLLHEPTAQDLREGAFRPAVDRLVARGEVRAWGASVRDVAAARAALELPGLGVLQVPCSAVDTSVVDAVRDTAAARGVGLVAIAALGDGRLLDRAAGVRPGTSRSALVAELAAAALRTPGVDAVLVGMSTGEHVDGLLAALPAAGHDLALADDLADDLPGDLRGGAA